MPTRPLAASDRAPSGCASGRCSGNLKWAVICARQAADHRSGLRRSHELASLGRRICEPEWDLLELIGAAA